MINYSSYSNNPLFKLNHLDYFNDIRNTFSNGLLNYKFVPVKSSEYQNTTYEDVTIKFDIDAEFRYQFINQYLHDYQIYLKVLDNESLDKQYLEQVKYFLFQNSNIINSYVKGSQIGIESILGIFCKNLHHYIYYVEDSTVNFVYRITSTLNQTYWNNIIKPIVHPVSWSVEYIELKYNDANNTNVWIDSSVPYENYKINYRDSYKRIIDAVDVFEYRKSYLTVGNDLPYNTDTTPFDISSVGNFETPFLYSNFPAEYSVEIDINLLPYDSHINDNYVFVETATNQYEYTNSNNILVELVESDYGNKQITFEYLFTGVATRYKFMVYDHTIPEDYQLLYHIESDINKIVFMISNDITTISIVVMLWFDYSSNIEILDDEFLPITTDANEEILSDISGIINTWYGIPHPIEIILT